MTRGLIALAILVVAAPGGARAEVDGRLVLSTMLLGESQDGALEQQDASPTLLAYGELRGVLVGKNLDHGLEMKGDFRLRLTSDFRRDDALVGRSQVTARGYSGGREYDLREAWVGRRGRPRTRAQDQRNRDGFGMPQQAREILRAERQTQTKHDKGQRHDQQLRNDKIGAHDL